MPSEERSDRLSAGRSRRGRARELVSGVAEARPRGVGELLDLASEVLLARFGLLMGVSFGIWVVIGFLQRQLGLLDPIEPGPGTSAADLLAPTFLNLAAILGASAVIGAVATHVTFRYLLGAHRPVVGLARAIPALGVVTLLNLVVLLAVLPLTFGLGSVILWYKLLYAPCIVVVESPRPLRAMRRSWQLTSGSFGRCLAVYVGASLLTVPLSLAAGGVEAPQTIDFLQEWGPTLPPAAVEALTLLFAALLQSLPTAFAGVVLTTLYADGLVRREGWDLDLRLAGLETARGVDTGPAAPAGVEDLV